MKYTTIIVVSFIVVIINCARSDMEDESSKANNIINRYVEIRDSIGIEMGDSNFVFGYISDVVIDDSLVFVLDMSKARISVYNLQAEYLYQIGRYGNGPNEFQSPRSMLVDNSIFYIQDMNRLIEMSNEGEWISNILQHNGNWPRQNVLLDDSTFCFVWHEFVFDDNPYIRPFIALYNTDGQKLTELWADSIQIPVPPDENNEAINTLLFSHYIASDQAGHLFIHEQNTNQYRIECYDKTGNVFNVISIDYIPQAKSESEIAIEKQYVEDMLRGWGSTDIMQLTYEPNEYLEPISGVWVNGDGNLWVLKGNEETPTFDVWSIPECELLCRVVLDITIPLGEYITFYMTPNSRAIAAVHEDEYMLQKVYLIDYQ